MNLKFIRKSVVLCMVIYGLFDGAIAFAKLEDSLKKMGKKVSAQIVNLSTKEVALSVNADLPLNPASSVKLFTAYAALDQLGPAYQFKTEFFQNEKGDICVKGGGDPSFVMEDLYVVTEALKRKGIESFSGKITLDASVFDQELYPEERNSQDSERAYNAPISGLNFNYNTISVFVNPTALGKPARIGLDFPFSFVKVQGKVTTAKTSNVTWDKKGKGEKEIVYLGGKISESAEEWRKPFRIRDPNQAFGEAVFQMFSHGGIATKAAMKLSTGTCSGNPVYTHVSKPLYFTIDLMDKYSNNFIADSLVKILDVEAGAKTGTTRGGLKKMHDIFKKAGIDLSASGRALVSGSGLSDGNAIAASDFIKLLSHIELEKTHLPEMFTSLPIAGIDGTLKKKYQKTAIAGKMRGKTGSLTGVQSLVGVYPNQKGEWIGVAIIVNHGAGIPEGELAQSLEVLNRLNKL